MEDNSEKFQNSTTKRTGAVITLGSEPNELVIRDKAFSMAGDPAPWAELDPTSSWSNKATILTPVSSSRLLLSEDVESINAWNWKQKVVYANQLWTQTTK